MEQNYSTDFRIPEDSPIDIKRYLSLFLSNWYWFAIALFIALTFAYGINRYSQKIYTVSSTLLIKDDQIGGGLTGADAFIPGGEYFKSKQNLTNEMGILKSYSLNYKVIEQLKDFHITYIGVGRRNIVEKQLYTDCPFVVIPDSGVMNPTNSQIGITILNQNSYIPEFADDSKIRNSVKFGERYNDNKFSFIIKLRDANKLIYDDNKSNKYYFWFENLDYLTNRYRNKLSVSPIVENSSLITLSCTGPVVEQEVDYLNKLMDVYIDYGLDIKNMTADSTIKFIDSQLNSILGSLSFAENKLEKFRSDNKLIDLSSAGEIIQSRLEKYGSEKTVLELQQHYYQYLKDYLVSKTESGDIVSPTVIGVSDPELIRLIQELAQLQAQKKQISLNIKNGIAPNVLIEEGIERVKASLSENVEGSIKSINSSLADVNNRISILGLEIEKLPGTEGKMITIQRDYNVNNTVYTYLLEKRAEAGIAKASNVSDNRTIDRAYDFNSSLIKPKAKRNYMMALIFGFFAPMLGIFLIDYLNNKIIDKKDVERGTDAPVIGFISHSSSKSEIPVNEKPGSTLAESFRSVRTSLKYFIKEKDTPVIVVSSTISAEGKTFISINLATIIAMLGKKVLLVGLDLRKPRIHRVLEIENEKGLSTYLSGGINFDDVIQDTSIKNLWYAPSGPVPPNPAELIETGKMKDFIESARNRFDYIIIDTPPIAIVTDALLIAPYVDMYLLVVRQRYTSKNTLTLIQELYKNGTLKNLAIVINDISLTGYYGYGLRYGYSIGYGYSYGYNYYGKYSYGRYGDNYGRDSYYKDE